MPYPTNQPAWQQQELNNLANQGLLSGINPLVLSGILANESGFENAGAGINSSGYGGFYGLGQNSTYSYGGQSFTESPGILNDPGLSSFDQQSEAAAAEVASLLQSNNGNLQAALAQYTGGGPTNGDYELAMQYLNGAGWQMPQKGSGELVVTGTGGAPPGGGTYAAGGIAGTGAPAAGVAGTAANLAAFGGGLNPANWPGELINALKPWVARILLVIVALILLKVGLDHLMDTDKSPAGIIVDSIPTPKGATKTVKAPGAQRSQTDNAEGEEESSTEEESEHEEEEPAHEESSSHEEGDKGAEGEEGEEAADEAPEAAAAA